VFRTNGTDTAEVIWTGGRQREKEHGIDRFPALVLFERKIPYIYDDQSRYLKEKRNTFA
jgi:hypothetical protein